MTRAVDDQRPLRILLMLHYPLDPNAGAAGCTIRLADSLRKRGHDVSIFSVDEMRTKRGSKVDLMTFPFEAAAVALRRLRAREVDVVDATTGDLWPLPKAVVRRLTGITLTRSYGLENREHVIVKAARDRGEIVLRRRYFVYYGGIRLKLVARSARVVDAALLASDGERDWAVENLRLPQSRARFVRAGLADRFIGLPAPAPSTGDRLGIALIGPYDWRKGAGTAAAVLSRTLRAHPGVNATWLGASETDVAAAIDADVRDRVRVIPRFENADLPSLLADHHLLLFLSRSEGYPGAVLEAMACGLGVISTDTGNCRQLLEPTGAGRIVPLADVDAIVAAIEPLVNDRTELDEMRRIAHREAQALGWDGVAVETEQLYRELLAEKSRRR